MFKINYKNRPHSKNEIIFSETRGGVG